jgi:hypothetical protein
MADGDATEAIVAAGPLCVWYAGRGRLACRPLSRTVGVDALAGPAVWPPGAATPEPIGRLSASRAPGSSVDEAG